MAAAQTKNKKKSARGKARSVLSTMAAAETGAAAGSQVIVVPAGGTLEVVVDVGPMVFPYTVAFAGRTLIKSLVDRKEIVPATPGDAVLAWSFAHGAKDWSHSIGFSINNGPVEVLESRSEKSKDPDASVGFAVVTAQ